MAKTRGVIFDLDGVIVDTAKYHYLGWKRLADDLGVPFDEVKNEKLKGLSRRDSLLALLSGKAPEEAKIAAWCDKKNGYYLELVKGITRQDMLPGALEMITALKSAPGWTQALASSSKNARLILEKLDIAGFFAGIVDGNETEKTKPNPELFLRAAQKINLTPRDCVVMEDAESGVLAAKNAGMLAVGLGDAHILKQADLVVKDLSKISIKNIENLFEKTLSN